MVFKELKALFDPEGAKIQDKMRQIGEARKDLSANLLIHDPGERHLAVQQSSTKIIRTLQGLPGNSWRPAADRILEILNSPYYKTKLNYVISLKEKEEIDQKTYERGLFEKPIKDIEKAMGLRKKDLYFVESYVAASQLESFSAAELPGPQTTK